MNEDVPHAGEVNPRNVSRKTLGGNNRLAEDLIAELGLEGCRCDEVHAVADDFSEVPLKPHELKEANRAAEFDEQIDVTIDVVVSGFAASGPFFAPRQP